MIVKADRKSKHSTADGATEIFALAQMPRPKPPSHSNVPLEAMPFWDSIVDCRSYSSWFGHDLEVAADLAKDHLVAVVLRETLRSDGLVDSNGKPRPENTLLDAAISRINRTTRLLLINTASLSAAKPETAKSTAAEKKARETLKTMDKYDGLIPGRSH